MLRKSILSDIEENNNLHFKKGFIDYAHVVTRFWFPIKKTILNL